MQFIKRQLYTNLADGQAWNSAIVAYRKRDFTVRTEHKAGMGSMETVIEWEHHLFIDLWLFALHFTWRSS
jgi:hypothetical protein